MKKKTKNIVIISIAAVSIFIAGSTVGASTNWLDLISMDNAQQIDTAGKAKVSSLTTNTEAQLEATVKAKMKPLVDAKKADLEQQIQAYFDQKASDATNTPQYQAAVADLDRIEHNLLVGYKAQIDKAFAGH